MLKNLFFISCIFALLTPISAQNQIPQISNLQIVKDDIALNISYDLVDVENDPVEISFRVSDNEGRTYTINTDNATGDIGYPVMPGSNKEILWQYNTQISATGNYKIRLIADDLQPVNIADIVAQVDSNRLLSNSQMLDGIRHRTTNPGFLKQVQDSIESRFRNGCDWTGRQTFAYQSYTPYNILGKKVGVAFADSMYIIDAHYDTVDNSPGADDNGSGTAGMLEAMRVLSPYIFANSVQFIGFDLEEAGLVGSNRYVNNGGILPEEKLQGVFNYEMIGYYTNEPNTQNFPTGFNQLYPDTYAEVQSQQFRGNFITNVGNNNSESLRLAYDSAAARYVPDLRVISFSADRSGLTPPDLLRSDHAMFWFNGDKALLLTDGAEFRNSDYHTSNDQIDDLNFTFIRQVVQATVGAVADLANPLHASQAFGEFEILTATKELDCKFTLSPIPASEYVEMKTTKCNYVKLNWQLFDVTGHILKNGSWNPVEQAAIQLDVSGNPAGLYFLRLGDGQKYRTFKFVIE